MLKYNKEIIQAVSEIDDMTIMVFRAEIDKNKPQNSTMDIKKISELSYRQYRDEASADRKQFQDMIFKKLNELESREKEVGSVREVSEVGVFDNVEY